MEDDNHLERSKLLYGSKGVKALQEACVLVVGCGGVGSFAVEALARSGIGKLILIDKDIVEDSNRNRQLCALVSTVGKSKTKVLQERILDINPQANVITYDGFYEASLNEWLALHKIDYILDCIDSIGSKKDLILFSLKHTIPLISSMGMARRKDPTKIEIKELEKTTNDPMAKILRTWKRKNKIRKKIWTVCSNEVPMAIEAGTPLPSAIFVPASAGMVMASRCVTDLVKSANALHTRGDMPIDKEMIKSKQNISLSYSEALSSTNQAPQNENLIMMGKEKEHA